jgi:hypothetical protein
MNHLKSAIAFISLFFQFSNLHSQSNALQFDGMNDYVQLPNQFNVGSNNFTFEVWVNPAVTTYSIVFAQDIGGDANQQFRLATTSTMADFAISGAASVPYLQLTTPANTVPTNEWTHLAVVRNGTTISLYINGILQATGSSALIDNQSGADPTKPFRIGARGALSNTNGENNFNGAIDELRYWNIARTVAQIKARLFESPAVNASNLVAMYKFDTGSGTVLVNSCTNTPGINGTITNGPAWVASPITYSENAINLDGTNDVVAVGAPNPANSSFTREAWVNIPSHAGNLNIISSNMSPFWISGGVLKAGIANNYTLVNDIAAFPLNTWVHVAVTFDDAANTMKLYRDGVLVNTNSAVAASYTAENTFIGSHQGTGSFFSGSIDEVRFWNVARTQAEIQNNRNTEITPANEPDLAAYYTFNHGIITGNNSGLRVVPDQKGAFNGVLNNFALTGATSNYVTQNISLITLPLLWKEFKAVLKNEQVCLQWSTASEQNTKSFTVQHHTSSIEWKDLASVTAAGNSSTAQYYAYTHQNPSQGINYYRILQTDIDGQQSYSEVKSVSAGKSRNNSFVIKNNLVTNGSIQVQVNKSSLLFLYNTEGKLLLKNQFAAGLHDIAVPGLPKGMYILQADNQKEKILVQ